MAFDIVLNSDQYENTYVKGKKNPPYETRGRLRIVNFDINVSARVAPGEFIRIQKIPAGNSLLMGFNSWAWLNINRDPDTIDFGYDEYVTIDGATVAGDEAGLGTLNVASFGGSDPIIYNFDTVAFGRFLFSARDGVDLVMSPNSAAINAGSQISGCLVYVID